MKLLERFAKPYPNATRYLIEGGGPGFSASRMPLATEDGSLPDNQEGDTICC